MRYLEIKTSPRKITSLPKAPLAVFIFSAVIVAAISVFPAKVKSVEGDALCQF
jgi:hypothetical protein